MTTKKIYNKWTPEEEQRLLTAVFEKKELAPLFPDRSAGALHIRILKIVNAKIEAGKLTESEAMDKYGVKEEDLEKDRNMEKSKLVRGGASLIDTVKRIRDMCDEVLNKSSV